MPTMTNPETGETKEISMEEFMEAMKNGNGSIQQVVTHADGTKTSTTLFGNLDNDESNQMVNIFVDNETFNAFLIRKIRKLTGEIDESEEDSNPQAEFEMLVDFTDSSIMGILKKTKKELSINLYTRDEQRATFDHLKQGSKKWEVDTDGSIKFNGEVDLEGEDKTNSLYMLSFIEMRRFLMDSGKLQDLEKLGNRGSGVILKATDQADDATATIVRGANRPDLPCNVFLLGEQMMRPYIDEIMSGMMLSGMSIEEQIEAAENGNSDAMEYLAQMYLNGDDGVEQDFEKSAYWWEKLANTDNSIGQFNIGLHYAKGCGVKRDFAKATEWLKKASENGDEDADFIIEKIEKAVKAEKIVSTGDAQAQADLAATYMFLGNSLDQMGPDKDYKLAFDMAQKSAAQNNGDGLWALALCYEHGRGIKKDVKKAVDCYKKGSLIGHAPSLHSLACYYARGEIVPKNMKMAFELSIRSAEYGYGLAMQTVGSCYQFANGVVGNMDTAIKWYETALKFIDDFELERKVQGFKMMQEADPKRAKEEYHGIDSTKKLIAADRDFLDKVDAAIEVNPTLKKCKEVEPLLKKIKEAKRLEEEKKRAEAEKKAREAEEKRLKEEKRKDEIYNTIIASDPKTVSNVESIIKKLEGLGDWKDSASKLKEYKEKLDALKAEKDANDKKITERIRKYQHIIKGMLSVRHENFVCTNENGIPSQYTHFMFDESGGKSNISRFSNIKSIVVTHDGIVGLRKDGSCIATNPGFTYSYIQDCNSWNSIVQIAAGGHHVVGLREDGTCVANRVKWNTGYGYNGQCDVQSWNNIKYITCGEYFTIGLKFDGTVVVAGETNYSGASEVRNWKNIELIEAHDNGVIGVDKNGKIFNAGKANVSLISSAKNIVDIAVCCGEAYALLADGKVVGKDCRNIENVAAIISGFDLCMLKKDGCIEIKEVMSFNLNRIKLPNSLKLFNNYEGFINNIEDAENKKAEEMKRIRQEKEERQRRQAEYRKKGLCQHCGGEFKKGLLGVKCVQCKKRKDY